MKLDDLRLFVHVVKHGSFSAASRSLNVPAATLTRRIQHLEKDLDVKLLVRNARGLTLTNAGDLIWKKSSESIFELEDLSSEIKDDIHEMEGVISIAAPICFINEMISPMLYPFLRKHPGIRIDFLTENDDYSSRIFYEDSVDVAFRFGDQKDSSLVAKRLGGIDMIFSATPEYIEQKGIPRSPEDLLKHDMLGYRGWSELDFHHKDGEQVLVKTEPKIQGSDPDILFRAATAGFGIFPMPDQWFNKELTSGELMRILPEWKGPACDIYMVYTSNNYLPARVRAMIDYISEQWDLQAMAQNSDNNLATLLK